MGISNLCRILCIWALMNSCLLPLSTSGFVRISLKRVHQTTLHNAIRSAKKLGIHEADFKGLFARAAEKHTENIYLKNYMNTQFVGEIGIGTPAQKFSVIFDTAITYVWIPSSKCNSSKACEFHSKYNSSNSSTYTKIGTPHEIIYGTEAKISGILSQDYVQVGGLHVKDQLLFEAIVEESQTLILAKFDGVVGLAYPDKSNGLAPLIWNTMAEQGLLRKNMFSIWFNPNPEAEIGGEIVFGGVDPNHFKGEHTYVPVTPNQNGIWQIEIGEFFIGEHSSGYCQEGCAAVLDSGSPLLSGPTAIVIEINHAIGGKRVKSMECKEVVFQYGEAIHALLASGINPDKICSKLSLCSINKAQYMRNDLNTVQKTENRKELASVADEQLCNVCKITVIWIQNQMKQEKSVNEILDYISKLCYNFPAPEGNIVVPCDHLSHMPNLTLTIGNRPFTFTPKQYIHRSEEHDKMVCRSQFYAVDLQNPPGSWIFGNTFMGVFHSVFDFGKQRVGFADGA
ncbi:aspartic proteinase-like isoform X2 [Amaranthus tricolor]|uniref:aspartic proteinase-like isoform X2 n=1 Tax=Amaranthus tricolor TaxID=29722 RepID=UPI00258309C1|nr:aspartic proteinase-like isoform X2 [Amaranthus tricolor]XP_057539711.1 aspartic proteinase-like isoform X2 [Amaranthus tricolor]